MKTRTLNTPQIEFTPEFLQPVNSDTLPFPQKSVTEQNQALINREFESNLIRQRSDGYIDATAMCKATGKQWKHYNENTSTKAFILALSSEVGIPTSELIQSLSGGNPQKQGTWVHPRVAIHLAQWCSPEFAVKVTSWVFDLMTKGEVCLKPSVDAPPIQGYIDECIRLCKLGLDTPPADSRALIRKALSEGCVSLKEISFYTGKSFDSVKRLVRRMEKDNEVSCLMVSGKKQVFLS
ncbi:KilA-N domain-containing protein [Candidatus Albibeggiatoa sp. nov. BB20]|uniref:KilA-N domain-containing protein n=1 Tax=Candidatus Albibeggiatoa sp. nov. BB20 TaxID=3162723 RepID=UPI00336583D0